MESLAAVMTTRCDREMNRWQVSGNICRSTVMRRANRYQKAIREHTRYHKGKRRPEFVESDLQCKSSSLSNNRNRRAVLTRFLYQRMKLARYIQKMLKYDVSSAVRHPISSRQ
jgi:hypothetical protein